LLADPAFRYLHRTYGAITEEEYRQEQHKYFTEMPGTGTQQQHFQHLL
jgi:hypothetical protein